MSDNKKYKKVFHVGGIEAIRQQFRNLIAQSEGLKKQALGTVPFTEGERVAIMDAVSCKFKFFAYFIGFTNFGKGSWDALRYQRESKTGKKEKPIYHLDLNEFMLAVEEADTSDKWEEPALPKNIRL